MALLDYFQKDVGVGSKVYIKDRSKAPRGAQIHTGPKGGLYYWSSDDPKSGDYVGEDRTSRDSVYVPEKYGFKGEVDEEKLALFSHTETADAWREGDIDGEHPSNIMDAVAKGEWKTNIDATPEEIDKWERTYDMLPDYIKKPYGSEQVAELLRNRQLPIYNGDIEVMLSNTWRVEQEPYGKKYIQAYNVEGWSMWDPALERHINIWVPVRNDWYKHNVPDDMEKKLEMVTSAWNQFPEGRPYPAEYVSFTPKEMERLFDYEDRNGVTHECKSWGSSTPRDLISTGLGVAEHITIYDNAEVYTKGMYHEFAHSLSHQMESPKYSGHTDSIVGEDGEEIKFSWNEDWLWSAGEDTIKSVSVKDLKNWNDWVEKYYPGFEDKGRESKGFDYLGGTPEGSLMQRIFDDIDVLANHFLNGNTPKVYGDKELDSLIGYKDKNGITYRNPTKEELEEHPYDLSELEGAIHTGMEDPRWADKLSTKEAENQWSDLAKYYGKKSDYKGESWYWDSDNWMHSNTWKQVRELLQDRQNRFNSQPTLKEIYPKETNFGDLTDEDKQQFRQKWKDGDETWENPSRGQFSRQTPEKMHPEGYRVATFSKERMNELQTAKDKIRLAGRYNSGFKTAYKSEHLHDADGQIREYGNQSASESFADMYGFIMEEFAGLKKHRDEIYHGKPVQDLFREDMDDVIHPTSLGYDFDGTPLDWENIEDQKETWHYAAAQNNNVEKEEWDEYWNSLPTGWSEWKKANFVFNTHGRNLEKLANNNPFKWDWFARNILRKDFKKYGLQESIKDRHSYRYLTPHGAKRMDTVIAGEKKREKTRQQKESWKVYEETGKLPEGWTFKHSKKRTPNKKDLEAME